MTNPDKLVGVYDIERKSMHPDARQKILKFREEVTPIVREQSALLPSTRLGCLDDVDETLIGKFKVRHANMNVRNKLIRIVQLLSEEVFDGEKTGLVLDRLYHQNSQYLLHSLFPSPYDINALLSLQQHRSYSDSEWMDFDNLVNIQQQYVSLRDVIQYEPVFKEDQSIRDFYNQMSDFGEAYEKYPAIDNNIAQIIKELEEIGVTTVGYATGTREDHRHNLEANPLFKQLPKRHIFMRPADVKHSDIDYMKVGIALAYLATGKWEEMLIVDDVPFLATVVNYFRENPGDNEDFKRIHPVTFSQHKVGKNIVSWYNMKEHVIKNHLN